MVLQAALLATCLGLGVGFGPFADSERPMAVVVGMFGVAAMATQNALVKLALPGAPSTAVMTTNTTQLIVDLATLARGLGKPDDTNKDGDEAEARVCELVPSFGPATTRLICAESKRTLDDLGPWLARTVPRATYPSDVHAELHLAPLRSIVTQMRRLLPMFRS